MPEAERDRVCSAARLQLREQATQVRLDGFLRDEQRLADFCVGQSLGCEFEHLLFAPAQVADLLVPAERDHSSRSVWWRRQLRRGRCARQREPTMRRRWVHL